MLDRVYLAWQWVRVHRRLGLKVSLGTLWQLERQHRIWEDQRFYHTWHHVAEVVRFATRNYEASAQRDLAVLALFFHDAVYVPGNKDNEQRSADLWEAHGQAIQAQETLGWKRYQVVTNAILMTQHHAPRVTDSWALGVEKIVSDSDMSIMLQTLDTYWQYAHDISREFAHVGSEAYVKGRLEFLESLNPRSMFYTAAARSIWDRALVNIEWEKGVLSRSPRRILESF